MAVIYALKDRQTGEVRYIGKANCANKRLKSHMRDARRRDTPVYCWIRKHGEPLVEVLEECGENWKAAERRIIADLKAQGVKLLNVAEGGDEPYCSREQRAANGRRNAKARRRAIWAAYRFFGQEKQFFLKSRNVPDWWDREESAAKCEMAIKLLRRLEASAKANGTLDQLEAALSGRFG